MILNEELSVNEKQMFRDLGWEYLFDTDVAIMSLYEMAIKRAFGDLSLDEPCWGTPVNPDAVLALQRAINHLYDKYRRNPEFEELISY